MIRIAICDDDKRYLAANEGIVRKYITSNKIIAEIHTFQSGEFFWHNIEEGCFYDLILLDIEMPGKNGMDIAHSITKYSPTSLTIFITSYQKFAVNAFEYSIFRYVLKDEINTKLEAAVKDALFYIELQSNMTYNIHTAVQFQRIPYKNIISIQKDGKYSIMVLLDSEIRIRKSLNEIFSELDSKDFVFTDRSYIVNLIHIIKLDDLYVFMSNNTKLAVSKKRHKELKEIINTFWGDKL
ncbi:MAG: LytTR family DNA-binding domain-containing protein [Lachnoclostridium sp.]|jgi:DNA-binding LytR/AlgR family response regulator|nr:LytTR family DNA-binding domain-containing protein [Lachnoclostridium sp.]